MPYLGRTPDLPAWWLFCDPVEDPWRDDPRFERMIAKLGFAAEHQVARATLARMLRERSANS